MTIHYNRNYPHGIQLERLAYVALFALQRNGNGPDGTHLKMADVHHCKTTHCIAGWALCLAAHANLNMPIGDGPKLEIEEIGLQTYNKAGTFPSMYYAKELIGVETGGWFYVSQEEGCDYLRMAIRLQAIEDPYWADKVRDFAREELGVGI